MVDVFRGFNTDVVISGELGLRSRYYSLRPSTRTTNPTQANGGFWGGCKEPLLQFLYGICKYVKPPNFFTSSKNSNWDDQTAIQEYLKAKTPGFNGKWIIDDKSKLVHTGAWESSNTFSLLSNNQVLHIRYNRILTPFFYHGCGASPQRGFFNAVKHVRSHDNLFDI